MLTAKPLQRSAAASGGRGIAAFVGAIASLFLTVSAFAAEGDYQPFKPDAGGEAVSAPLFVVIAYSAIWLVLVGFVIAVWRRQREVQREIDRLAKELAGAAGSNR